MYFSFQANLTWLRPLQKKLLVTILKYRQHSKREHFNFKETYDDGGTYKTNHDSCGQDNNTTDDDNDDDDDNNNNNRDPNDNNRAWNEQENNINQCRY